ncbi:hypothetical protein EHE19_018780 [Ruminiclostridium herbifermentans]|uniref:Zn-finger containing protein n=1 Tax=Ruminiclostridium herbifermentans TaxID=2488810 RepID=A0A4U7JB50_9FIRM|nr:hypothetical protein [Ruminiclostridium herbifermentans]QNU66845.1 hypothetical protein EHE19_018780 [Ruminiclostridium herbifermentans]
MGSFKDKLFRFMYGRYGQDQLYYACLIACFVLITLNTFFRSYIIMVLIFGVFALMIFRAFSKNINKRRMENEKFLKIWNPVKGKFKLTIRRIKERKTHCFRTCPSCKKILRLPRKKGNHVVSCPCCKNDFNIKVR